jgi:hypothetical protein
MQIVEGSKIKKLRARHISIKFKEQSSYKSTSIGWLRLIQEKCNEITGNYLVREHKHMSSTFRSQGKLRLNRVMDAIGFKYPDYTDPAANTKAGEKWKRATKTTSKASKKAIDDEIGSDESKNDEEPPSGPEKKAKIAVRKTPATQDQGKGSATTTSSLGYTRILKVITQLGSTLTRLMTTTKGTDEGGQTLASSKGKYILSKEEVDNPRIQNIGGAAFGYSSSLGEEDEKKAIEGGGSSGHEKAEEEAKEPSFALGIDTVDPTQSSGEEIDELGFFVRHLGEGELSDKEASELENKSEAMGYGPGAMLFGREDQMLMCVPDADESKFVRNIT